ncbi:receptor-type tyrosine-protein phosphatase N2 isoform X4 [Nelusetta ayraudi]|uniref:receptor-type tyrosine-protein phosphatase N2 isoform X4 n=1 Tax=Nelusetta ayraudi TaxID=303726 RepID=UPI003F6EC0CF
MDSPWSRVLVAALAACLCCSPSGADRKFGCLFEDELCAHYEFCLNDGVFGRCQDVAAADLYTYDVSSSALQRLRILLQKLAHRGLTWQDDVTQQVISRELSRLRSVPLHHRVPPSGPFSTSYSSSRDRKLRPELSRNLQQYLSFLSQLDDGRRLGLQGQDAHTQNDDIKPDPYAAPSQTRPQQGWKETTLYSVHRGDGQPPLTKVFTKSGEGRHPVFSAAHQPADQDPARSKLLSSHLERLLAGAPATQQADTGGDTAWPPAGRLRYLNTVHQLAPDGQSERPPQLAFGPKAERPNLDKLLFNAGANRHPAKEHHDSMDDKLLQNMVNQMGGHSFNLEALMGKDFDELARVLTGALQKERPLVGAKLGPGAFPSKEGDRDPPAVTPLTGDLDLKFGKVQESNQKDTDRVKQTGQQVDGGGADKEPVDKHAAFFSKLLDYLNLQPFDDAPGVRGPPAPLQKMVGLESVQSRTKQSQVPLAQHGQEKTEVVPAAKGSTLRLTATGAEGPDTQVDSEIQSWMQGHRDPGVGKKPPPPQEPQQPDVKVKTQLVHVGVKEFSSRGKGRHFGYIITGSDSLTSDQGLDLMERVTQRLHVHAADLTQLSVLGPALTFRIGSNPKNVSTADLVQVAVEEKQRLEKETGLKIVEAGVSDRGSLTQIPVVKETRVESGQFLLLSVLCMLFILVALAVSASFFCVRQRSHLRMKEKLASLGTDTSTDATATYQELCRQRMAIRTSERVERPETLRHSRLNSVSSQFSDGLAASPSTRSSTSSWCEEPVPSNMDISTGHMILSYMEDHLKNKNRLEREWEALCSYQAEPSASCVGRGEQNTKRNRSDAVVAYDHSRIALKAENNHGNSDYINASPIMDHDPRNPTYISSQGPLPTTVADFWQMVWESGCVVVVMLTPLSENGVKQCHHYWPDEGSDVYHIYEVNLVSEHIWCEDFLVRSFYLKNLQTNETRTVTQFHFLSWMDRGIPSSARTLLDFRRKVNKCYRGRSCPIIVHCSDGAGRSGTYILIDMVLNKMAKGAKEIDIAATLEHLRDQRAGMVQTKEKKKRKKPSDS